MMIHLDPSAEFLDMHLVTMHTSSSSTQSEVTQAFAKMLPSPASLPLLL
jgi:hypothetical protein